MPRHRPEAPEGQRALQAARVADVDHAVEGHGHRRVLVGDEEAEEDPTKLEVVHLNALGSETEY